MVLTHDVQEGVASRSPVIPEHTPNHQPQLVIAQSRIHPAYLSDGVHYALLASHALRIIVDSLIISLFCMAKQSAAVLDRVSVLAGQAFYCLAPDFFLILMPCSSAMSMRVFRARTLSWLVFRSFSSLDICF